jgi:hypothetical protein
MGVLYCAGQDQILRHAIKREETKQVLSQCHEGVYGGHFMTDTTTKRILTAKCFWPTLFQNSAVYCKTCEMYQVYGGRIYPHTELRPIIPTGAFEKRGIDFVSPLLTSLTPKVLRG